MSYIYSILLLIITTVAFRYTQTLLYLLPLVWLVVKIMRVQENNYHYYCVA